MVGTTIIATLWLGYPWGQARNKRKKYQKQWEQNRKIPHFLLHYDEHGESYQHETMGIKEKKITILLFDQVPSTQSHLHCLQTLCEQKTSNVYLPKMYIIQYQF